MSETKTVERVLLENHPDYAFADPETRQELISAVNAYASPLRERIAELEHKLTFAKACLDRIGCLDFGTIHEGIAMEGLDKLINEGGK